MPFTTPEQIVLLGIVLLAGWLLGYASAPNARKWQRKMRVQLDSFTAYHRDAEDKLRAASQRAADLKSEGDALRADHADAERAIAALRASRPQAHRPVDASSADRSGVATGPAFPAEPSVAATEDAVRADAAGPLPATAEPETTERDQTLPTTPNDLSRIRGIDGVLATHLASLGITRFEDIEILSPEDELALERRLGLPARHIAHERWRTQAALLRTGEDAAHAARFGAAG